MTEVSPTELRSSKPSPGTEPAAPAAPRWLALAEWRERMSARLRRPPRPAEIVNALVLMGIVAFILWQLQPSLLFRSTTPAGGDMGAHVWQPAFLRDHLLPHGRLTGWAPDWCRRGGPGFAR